jgi:uncharacterized Zn finger protein
MDEGEALTISNFRNELDERALERGWMYFHSGWVKPPREVMPQYYEVVVEEVNPHAVCYSLNDDGSFTDIFCSCGDHQALACRHMAAVLFYYEALEAEKNRTPDWEDFEK